jgi:peptidoglycan hydrolase CwlO-like protein
MKYKVDSDEFLGYKFAKELPDFTKKIKKLKTKVAELNKEIDDLEHTINK